MGYDDTRAARVHRSLEGCTRAARVQSARQSLGGCTRGGVHQSLDGAMYIRLRAQPDDEIVIKVRIEKLIPTTAGNCQPTDTRHPSRKEKVGGYVLDSARTACS